MSGNGGCPAVVVGTDHKLLGVVRSLVAGGVPIIIVGACGGGAADSLGRRYRDQLPLYCCGLSLASVNFVPR